MPDILVALARLDARLFQLRQQIQNLPKRIAEHETEIRRLDALAREAGARFDQAEAARRKLETELGEFRAKRTKSEGRLATLTSTEQYQAVVKEIATTGERIDALESAVLEAMERSDGVRAQRDAEQARTSQAIEALRGQIAALEADIAAAQAAVPGVTAERSAVVQQVEPRTRALYERVLKQRGDAGLALVTVNTCGICKAVQPPQALQMLRQREVQQVCQMCGRILVWDGPEA